MMKILHLIALPFIIFLVSCGGGGGGGNSVAGIGGTGITATGTIDGFGSIFVNGIEFETDSASIVLDSDDALESQLRIGMVVTVRGTVDGSGARGTALSVEFDDDVQGPISAITVDADGNTKTLTVLGVTVQVDRVSTVFDDVSFDSLAVNDVVEVSGLYGASSVLFATRIEKKETFVAGSSEIELKGTVSALSGTVFSLGTFSVDFASADLSEVPGGSLSNGMLVEVKGTLSGSTIAASEVEFETGPYDDNEDKVSIEGLITDYVDNSNFRVAGQDVDASGATFEPTGLILEDGVQVEVEGALVNGTLVADEVEARGGEIRLAAPIQALDVSTFTGTVTLGFAVGSVDFTVNSQTELRDETDTHDPLTLADLRTGDFLEVSALLNDGEVIASEVRLDDPDDQVIQGPVDSFVSGSEITILGLTFLTPGEIFEDANDAPMSSAAFFSALSAGDIIKLEDTAPANGIADEVEFED